MKKLLLASALILIFLFPSLTAQGTPVKRLEPVAAAVKIRVWGSAGYDEFLSGKAETVFALIHLQRAGIPITGAIVTIQDTVLEDQGDGSYRGHIWHTHLGLGDKLTLSADFSRISPLHHGPVPFSGRTKVAEFTIGNTIRWIFPIPNQVIDLSAYPAGVPVRWDFTGTPGDNAQLMLKCDHVWVLRENVTGEELTVPAGIMQPGKLYHFMIADVNNYFKVSSSFDSSSSIKFELTSRFDASTQGAKK
jgi:hypothetical protein